MDLSAIPFDPQALLRQVRPWVECESPSWDAAAVSRMAAFAAGHLRGMGAEVRTIPGELGHGDCVLADFGVPGAPSSGILVLGHLDTVHPVGSLDGAMPWREEEGRCYGPGLYDMKSGICLALEALRQLRLAGVAPHLPVRFLLTSDEESGSRSTRGLIEHTASHARYVLVPEGAEPSGHLVTGRYPSARFQVWTRGRPSHALLAPGEGRSAITGMARLILKIEQLSHADCPLTVTYLNAGRTVSTVPVESYAEFVCTARSEAVLDDMLARLRDLGRDDPTLRFEVKTKSSRPTWTPTEADRALWRRARNLGATIGLDLPADMTFGGSDGNFTGALGVPTLDGLGPVGADAHQPSEHIRVDTIAARGRLLAGLLATLD